MACLQPTALSYSTSWNWGRKGGRKGRRGYAAWVHSVAMVKVLPGLLVRNWLFLLAPFKGLLRDRICLFISYTPVRDDGPDRHCPCFLIFTCYLIPSLCYDSTICENSILCTDGEKITFAYQAKVKSESVHHSVMSDSLQPHGL